MSDPTQFDAPEVAPECAPECARECASWILRVGAFLLDSLLLVPAYLVAFAGAKLGGGVLVFVLGYGVAIAFALWNQCVRQGRTGQSLGKEWIGITLVDERSEQPIGGWRAFGRWWAHLLDVLPCYVGFLYPIWDDKRQTFADKLMRTLVLRDAP